MGGLYSVLGSMAGLAICLLAVPFVRARKVFSWRFFCLCVFVIGLSGGIYYFTSPQKALREWFASGKEHYELLTQFYDLGGIEGTIKKIKQKLELNPKDAQGWFILGKLYLAGKKYPEAKLALEQAHELAPNDEEINTYYQFVLGSTPH